MLTAATTREIPPIARMNVVMVPSVRRYACQPAAGVADADHISLPVYLVVNRGFYGTDSIDILYDHVYLVIEILIAIMIGVPGIRHNDCIIGIDAVRSKSTRCENA